MNSTGINRMVEAVEKFLHSARFTVNGSQEVVDIRKVTRDNNHIRIFVYLPASASLATVTKVELIDDRGHVIDEKNDIMQKPARKGLMVAFDYTISEV